MKDDNEKQKIITAKKLAFALKKIGEGSDILDMPAWLIGSESDPSFTYGVIVGSREMVVGLLAEVEDMMVTGMLSTQYTSDKGELH